MTCAEKWTIAITALGVVATFSAVLVALYQTRVAVKKKLKVEFCDNVKVASQTADKFREYVSMTVTNIGNRNAIINNWMICGKTTNWLVFTEIPNDPDLVNRMLGKKTPHKLEPEDSVTFYYELKLFKSSLVTSVKHGEMEETQKVKFRVTDSTGKQYHTTSAKTIKEYLSEE